MGLLDQPRVAPSLLSADYARLGEQVDELADVGARVFHVDVMDGHFVPPITVGPLIVAALKERVHDLGGILDVHLMIERPERHVEEFARAGADVITVHAEATPHVLYTLQAIREAGCLAGLAVNPATAAGAVAESMGAVDLVLCMTVNPGWGGQAFIESSPPKIERLRGLIPEGTPLEVDGGVDTITGPRCAEAGATTFVAGSAVLGAPDPAAAYRELAAALGAA